MGAAESETDRDDDLVDRLASHGIRYFDGGSGQDISPAAPLAPLLTDLARSPNSRLRWAIIALLLRHPEHAPLTETVARDLPGDDPTRRLLLLGVVVAAALQSEWSFTLDLYLPHRPRIQADHLATEFGLPSPRQDYGRPCLTAAAQLLRQGSVFPFNYQDDWENAAHRLLAQLVREARTCGA